MKAENKQLLLQLLQQHKDLGISNQIDYDKFYLYSIITHSTAIEGNKMVDKADLIKEMVDKWSIKPSLAEKMVDILLFMADKEEIKTETIVRAFGFTETTAKRYLRQLAEFGYLEDHGGNRNRSYTKNQLVSDTHEFKLRGPDGKMRNYWKYLNLFVKPNEQSQVYLNSAMARKRSDEIQDEAQEGEE